MMREELNEGDESGEKQTTAAPKVDEQ